MNHQLNFNIISEPSLLIDGITSDNINDGYYSYSWIVETNTLIFCFRIPSNEYSNNYSTTWNVT